MNEVLMMDQIGRRAAVREAEEWTKRAIRAMDRNNIATALYAMMMARELLAVALAERIEVRP